MNVRVVVWGCCNVLLQVRSTAATISLVVKSLPLPVLTLSPPPFIFRSSPLAIASTLLFPYCIVNASLAQYNFQWNLTSCVSLDPTFKSASVISCCLFVLVQFMYAVCGFDNTIDTDSNMDQQRPAVARLDVSALRHAVFLLVHCFGQGQQQPRRRQQHRHRSHSAQVRPVVLANRSSLLISVHCLRQFLEARGWSTRRRRSLLTLLAHRCVFSFHCLLP